MEKQEILKEIGIYIFNRVFIKDCLEQLTPAIVEVFVQNKDIPKKAWVLIPDERYAKTFGIIYGFQYNLFKIKEPPMTFCLSQIRKMASRLDFMYMDEIAKSKLILHTLIVGYFEENIDILLSLPQK